jgi:hypothetical protein
MGPDLNARLTTEPAKPNGRAPGVATPEALAGEASEPGTSPKEAPPLRSVHTSNFSAILQDVRAEISDGVRAYAARRLRDPRSRPGSSPHDASCAADCTRNSPHRPNQMWGREEKAARAEGLLSTLPSK